VFVSRIHALMRRFEPVETGTTTVGDLEIDRERYLVIKAGRPLSFPRKEFELLSLLVSKPGRVFKREEILSRIWGTDTIVGDRTIDVHIRKVREKLGDDCIKTIKGVGYKFDI
jgi:two-component system alkaline phosphatase synthesis response regulator PhoP